MPTTTHAYGDHPDQVAELWLPDEGPPRTGWPVVALLHGGFWRQQYRRDLTVPLAQDLVAYRRAVWNIEYRRVRGAGGWPATFADVAAAIDHLGVLDHPSVAAGGTAPPVDLARVVVVGHSAGGHLALWAAGRANLPLDAPGAAPQVVPRAVVGLAPVADLRACHAGRFSDGAAQELLGVPPEQDSTRWALADPMTSVGHGIPGLVVHGVDDEDVPVAFSRDYVAAARAAGDDVELRVPSCGHMALIDPTTAAWALARRYVLAHTAGGVLEGNGRTIPVEGSGSTGASRHTAP